MRQQAGHPGEPGQPWASRGRRRAGGEGGMRTKTVSEWPAHAHALQLASSTGRSSLATNEGGEAAAAACVCSRQAGRCLVPPMPARGRPSSDTGQADMADSDLPIWGSALQRQPRLQTERPGVGSVLL
ncbi:hypothetical protein GGTG_02907 [Gaeumannomyces tritici R3-111a-1]|uniref:Uncharacterized protein n=1 Tax=Gaeumannomyces tritici (strain R3-111a-1) TaxID=644352 RepID=J3NNQ0_GAET3|nr:hypothetical protein GGTG_02907 [Gaeumannomyces tritici R3-111a-1]EJT77802.1 hypothetical protein GGTG_02907 [Gaeumannomyces tritici R3-111a-1]